MEGRASKIAHCGMYFSRSNWVWELGLTELQSPYAYNYYNEEPPHNMVQAPFKQEEVVQTSKLFTELFRARPVLEIIAKNLFQYHSMSWQFFATCQEAGRTMAQILVSYNLGALMLFWKNRY